MVVSQARRTVMSLVTSHPRPRSAVRSPRSTTATRSSSILRSGGSTWTSRRTRCAAGLQQRKRPRRAMRRGRSRSTRSLFRPRRWVLLPRSDDLRGYRDLRLLFEVGLSDELAPTRHGLDLGDAVRLVVHLDELADDRAIGDRRLPVEGSSVELDRDASGGGFQRGGRRSPPTPPLRAFCALSAAIRFFSALSRLGPFCFGTS